MVQNNVFNKFEPTSQRRKKARVRVDIPCNIYLNGTKKSNTGILVDLGSGGLRFLASTTYYAGDQLDVEFSLKKDKLIISGSILRISGKSVTLKYTSLNDASNKILQEFIYKFYFEGNQGTLKK